MDRRISHEVDGDALGDEFKGYRFRITGGNDKQGFPMKQGVLQPKRVRLLLGDGKCFHAKRAGLRKRRSVRGCIVGPDLSVLCLQIVKKGEQDLPGLTDTVLPRQRGPKRASKIRQMFNLSKKDDVRKYVVRREIPAREATEDKPARKAYSKAPKIQRLITPVRVQRKRARIALKAKRGEKSKAAAATYEKMLAQRATELKEKRAERVSKKRQERESGKKA